MGGLAANGPQRRRVDAYGDDGTNMEPAITSPPQMIILPLRKSSRITLYLAIAAA